MIDYRTGCPDAPIEPPEDTRAVVDVCCMCSYEIPYGEEYYNIHGDAVCEECGTAYLKKHKEVAIYEREDY